MSFKIQAPPTAQTLREAQGAVASGDPTEIAAKAKADADKVGRDFEAILLRQMLTKANVAGKSGYSDMAIENLASSLTAAGGLGLGRFISDQLRAHDHHANTSTSHDNSTAEKK